MRGALHLPTKFVSRHMPELAAAAVSSTTPLAKVQLLLLQSGAADATAQSPAVGSIDLQPGVAVIKLEDDCCCSAPACHGWLLKREWTPAEQQTAVDAVTHGMS